MWFTDWVNRATIEQELIVNTTKAKQMAKEQPARSPLHEAAEREAERGKLIGRLAEEAVMWRNFAKQCKPERWVHESYWAGGPFGESNQTPLSVRLDEISAPCWKAFAESMASQAEQRLREILG